MPYVEEICIALARTLEHATIHKEVRLAGYAANIQFWAGEIHHAMDCLEGYDIRFAKLKAARIAEAQQRGREVEPTWVTPSLTARELGRLRDRLHSAAAAFLRACEHYLTEDEIAEIELLVGIRFRNRRID